MLNAFDFH